MVEERCCSASELSDVISCQSASQSEVHVNIYIMKEIVCLTVVLHVHLYMYILLMQQYFSIPVYGETAIKKECLYSKITFFLSIYTILRRPPWSIGNITGLSSGRFESRRDLT